MRIGRIGHASLALEHGAQFVLMDPVLFDPFEAGSCTFDPAVTVDVAGLTQRATAILISHEHFDHFCPRSLAAFDRRTPVYYPEGSELIPLALDRLGFKGQPLRAWNSVALGELQLTPTLSMSPAPELGFFLRAGEHSVWNLVDTEADEDIIGFLRTAYGSPEVMIAPYQPLIEEPLSEDALGSAFPFDRYGHLLLSVWNTKPRCVVPGSSGLKLTREWLNHRMFPVSERQFAEDLRRVDPALQVEFLPHGGLLEMGEQIRLQPAGFAHAKAQGTPDPAETDWRPDLGVPPLTDLNRRHHALTLLRGEVDAFLQGKLLEELGAQTAWRERFTRIGARWRLEVVFPDDQRLVKELQFTAGPLRWSSPEPSRFAKLRTSVTASGLVGVLRGELSRYAFLYNEIRVVNRLFEPHRLGVSQAGDTADEPLTLLLKQSTDRRFVEHELAEILRTSV